VSLLAKRQRHVYPTREIPHLWAHQTQSDARNQQSNLYFEGPTIYSYGSHFPVASFHTVNGKQIVLFTTEKYSSTTAGHCSAVRSTIPHSVPIFRVPYVLYCTTYHERNLEHYVKEYDKYISSALSSLHLRNLNWCLDYAIEWRDEGKAYAKLFGLSIKFKPLPSTALLRVLRMKARIREDASDEKAAVKREAQRRRWARQAELEKLELPKKIEAWRNGEYVHLGYGEGVPTLLRLSSDGTEIETSRGARFSVEHAKLALRIVRKVMESGQEYKTNGHTIHLGHYTLDRITVDGTVYAGCHIVKWEEISLIAPKIEG
jgi:hypothetical protein